MPASMTPRRFPPPWTVEESAACFIVRDANGQALAYVYFEEEPGRQIKAAFRRSNPERGEVHRHPPRLVAREPASCKAKLP